MGLNKTKNVCEFNGSKFRKRACYCPPAAISSPDPAVFLVTTSGQAWIFPQIWLADKTKTREKECSAQTQNIGSDHILKPRALLFAHIWWREEVWGSPWQSLLEWETMKMLPIGQFVTRDKLNLWREFSLRLAIGAKK